MYKLCLIIEYFSITKTRQLEMENRRKRNHSDNTTQRSTQMKNRNIVIVITNDHILILKEIQWKFIHRGD